MSAEPRMMSIGELDKILSRDEGDEGANYHIGLLAERWQDFSFDTCDGRRFAFVYDDQGSLMRRLEDLSVIMTRPTICRLTKVQAAIVELKTSDGSAIKDALPIKFANEYDGLKAWYELRRGFGVPIIHVLEYNLFDVLYEVGELADRDLLDGQDNNGDDDETELA